MLYTHLSRAGVSGLDINVCPVPVKTDVGQVDLVLRLSDGTSELEAQVSLPVSQFKANMAWMVLG
jgi:hypothetical protein